MSVCYHGRRDRGNPEIIVHCPERLYIAPLPHIRNRADTMDWGDASPEADDLARSLLIHAAGRAAACPVCRGTRRVVWDLPPGAGPRAFHPCIGTDGPDIVTACPSCTDGWAVSLPYRLFTVDVVADWGDFWRIGRAEILTWLAVQRAEAAA